ncbi:MAG TPA: hypothetical protein VLX32_08815 [Candidatus Acidoferrum sp.]|nr:hypothetical protein [Candidatus Acidoferrum sp.]
MIRSVGGTNIRKRRILIVARVLLASAAASAGGLNAAELQEKTIEGFQSYVQHAEGRMRKELANPKTFLLLDGLPAGERGTMEAELRAGRVIVVNMKKDGADDEPSVPDGLVHHWMALVFVPGVHLKQVIAFVQDYGRYPELYKPDVQRAKVKSTDGQTFHVYMRLYRKLIVTAVYDTEFEDRYYPVDAAHEYSNSRATRIAEVGNPGESDEYDKPVGHDRGYLWRLNTYWRYEEKDGGVYIQVEFIALSRSVPFIYAWLVNPYIKSVPRNYLTHLLETTQQALTKRENAQRTSEKNEPKTSGNKALAGEARAGRRHGVYLTAAGNKNIVRRDGVLAETRNGCCKLRFAEWPDTGRAAVCML